MTTLPAMLMLAQLLSPGIGQEAVPGGAAGDDPPEEAATPAEPVHPATRSHKSLHPPYYLLDAEGNRVEATTGAVSDEKTCGRCHDTDYIRSHDMHRDRGQAISCFQCHLEGGLAGLGASDFDGEGRVSKPMTPPKCTTCGACHGAVHVDRTYFEYGRDLLQGRMVGPEGRTLATGEIFSPQLRAYSHVNLADKETLAFPWDVHAERGVHCITCHYPPNDPARAAIRDSEGPDHLAVDPRTMDFAEYLNRPDHRFTTASCEACHDAEEAHQDFPYPERHLESLSCQACHVPLLHGAALESADRTVVTPEGGPRLVFRNAGAGPGRHSPNTVYYEGFRPVLLHEEQGARGKFSPFNPVTTWAWVSADGTPVSPETVKRAWLTDDGAYRPELVAVLDEDRDGRLDDSELVLDEARKVSAVRARLVSLGVKDPHIVGRVTAHAVRHDVVEGKWVVKDCETCHADRSRFNEPVVLASGPFPGGVTPELDDAMEALLTGRYAEVEDGRLILAGNEEPEGHYVLGHSRRPWSDLMGFWIFVLSALGVAGHGVARFLTRDRRSAHPAEPEARVYMYGLYERTWHWTMAGSVVFLLLTGFQIHYPRTFNLMAFPTAVLLHNFFAAVLLVNAFLGMFFHLATGEIRQFLPEGAGLWQRLWVQARFYLEGIFVGASHPFVKSRESKLNPLQQFTYAGLLNVLFPFQVVTGLLLWVAGLVPERSLGYGGLAWVAPLHNLGSWLFLSFLVVHLYLTTTGHTLTSNIKAMVTGWDIAEGEPTGQEGEAI